MAEKARAKPEEAKPEVANAVPPPEVFVVHSKRIACDNVGGALGHPRVWLEMGEANFVDCLYCDRRYVLAAGDEGLESERADPGLYEGSHGH